MIGNSKFIKELKMTEPMFLIVSENKPISEPENKAACRYSTMLHSFLTTSYGYYSEMFMKKIAEAAESRL